MAPPNRSNSDEPINLQPLEIGVIEIPIIGVTPYIGHRFDEKSKAMMLHAMQSKTRAKKQPKDPDGEYDRARYRLDNGRDGIPATAFKAAIVDAARLFEGITMTQIKPAVFVNGEGPEMLVPIEGTPQRREDVVRLTGTTADLRYRPEYFPWKVTLLINFLPTVISAESIVALVDAAGFGGVGEWRPSKAKTGTYGRFRVADTERSST